MINSLSLLNMQDKSSYYNAMRNKKEDSVTIYYNNPHCTDEEMMYTFYKDGSAESVSCAWGGKTSVPAGTFSDLMLKLPKTGHLNSEIAKQMADAYRQSCK